MTNREGPIIGLGARMHLFVRPAQREAFIALFRDVLGCTVLERDFGFEHPLLLVSFADGSAFSVEVTDLAPNAGGTGAIDDEHASRGAWIEFRTRELDRLQGALRRAGVPEFRHRGSSHAYFVAPGGQVFRLLDAEYTGP